ncbi:hypothetical protein [Nocardia tengchongensis]|uniref:hypothetical protein n=1 Tax=Nocardia tengchongensis TaxID=2055889 RepID=UPI00367D6100
MRPLVAAEIKGSQRIVMRANDFPGVREKPEIAWGTLKCEKALQFSLKGLSQ